MRVPIYGWFLTGCCLLLLAACGVNPVTGRDEIQFVSEASEVEIGTQQYFTAQQSQGGPYLLDPGVTAYVREVGFRLARVSDRPQLPHDFVVLNNSTPNAWTLPGGKVAVNRGLLLELDNEAELAAVLAHELVHAAARHGAKAVERGSLLQFGTLAVGLTLADSQYADAVVGAASLGAGLINQKYSRDQELEADFYGMNYMVRAGYDPVAAVVLQEKFVRLESEGAQDWLSGLFASHPPSVERVEQNRQHLAQLPSGGQLNREQYQQRIAALLANREAYRLANRAGQALRQGDTRAAYNLASDAINREPREALFFATRGVALARDRDWRGAMSDLDRAIQLDNGYYKYFLLRGSVARELGMVDLARQDFGQSLNLLPTSQAHYALGEMAYSHGFASEAIEHYRAAASDRGGVGRRAAQRLLSLELPRDPERYIRVLPMLRGGDIYVVMQNLSSIPLRHVAVEVRVRERGGAFYDTFFLRAPILRPGVDYTEELPIDLRKVNPRFLDIDSRILEAEIDERLL